MDRQLFETMCPGLSLDFVLDALKDAVEIFGRNKVFSNILVGLGEDDQSIINGHARSNQNGRDPYTEGGCRTSLAVTNTNAAT